MDVIDASKQLRDYVVNADINAARRLAESIKPQDLPNTALKLDPQAIAGLKFRSLAAEVLDYVGASRRARLMVEDMEDPCVQALREASSWSRVQVREANALLHQAIWLLLQVGLCHYRKGDYDGAFRVFTLCKTMIELVAPSDSSDPRSGTRARIHYSIGLVHRERHQLDEALESFNISTEYAYKSLDQASKEARNSGTSSLSWLLSMAIARSLGLGMASVHGTMGRTDLAMPLLLAAKAMLPPEEVYISTHLDMLRLNMKRSSFSDPVALTHLIIQLDECHQTFEKVNHPLYRARAAYYLIRAHLHRGSLLSSRESIKSVDACKKLFLDLDESRSGDSRFPIYRLATESWLQRQRGTHAAFQQAEKTATKGLEQTNRAMSPYIFIDLCLARGKAREKLGNLKGACEDFTQALESARNANNLRQRAVFLLHLCRVSLLLEERAKARRFHHEYRELKSIAKVCTGDVIQLEKTIEKLLEKQVDVFSVALTDKIDDPPKKLKEFKSFLAKWAKASSASDSEAAKRLKMSRAALYAWSKYTVSPALPIGSDGKTVPPRRDIGSL